MWVIQRHNKRKWVDNNFVHLLMLSFLLIAFIPNVRAVTVATSPLPPSVSGNLIVESMRISGDNLTMHWKPSSGKNEHGL